MCVVSAVGNNWSITAPQRYDWMFPITTINSIPPAPSKEEFDRLKAEVEELKKLLKAAKEFDEKTGQPDCETEDKVALIKKIAEYVGVELDDLLK